MLAQAARKRSTRSRSRRGKRSARRGGRFRLSQPTDALEQQAEQLANLAVGPTSGPEAKTIADGGSLRVRAATPAPGGGGASVHRQPSAPGGGNAVGEAFANRLNAAHARGGEPLAPAMRAELEPLVAQNLSGVRVHRGREASALAREARARAFTVGGDIFFGRGEFHSETREGKRLIAHEAAHVGQQARGATGIQRQPLPGTTPEKGAGATVPCTGVLPDEAYQDCDTREPKPHGDLPPKEQWVTDPTLNKIRAQPEGSNKVLLSRGRGSRGDAVGLVQQAILAWGCREKELNLLPRFGADEAFGNETDAAVKKFQCEEGIAIDGVVGPETMRRLDAFVGTAPPFVVPELEDPSIPTPTSTKPGPQIPCERDCHFDFLECLKGSTEIECLAKRSQCLAACAGAPARFEVCARPLQIGGTLFNHAYVETPKFRYAVITPLCPLRPLPFENPFTRTTAQKWDNSPDPCDRRPTCRECVPGSGVTDLEKCFRDAFNAYPRLSLYNAPFGPNSNTFAGTLARRCCANMDPKPPEFGIAPGWGNPQAPPRAGKEPCPPGPKC